MDIKISLFSRNSWFWAIMFLYGSLNSARTQESGAENPTTLSSKWSVLLPIGADSLRSSEASPLHSVQNFKLHGPHVGHPFLLGDYETNGEWQVIDGELQRTLGENALLRLPEAMQFDVEGIFSSERLGGMLFLLGWTRENSGYVLYNVTMKDKASGSPWHLCRIKKGRFVEGQDREVARHEWEGVQSIRLSVRNKQLTLRIGKTNILQNHPLPAYTRGNILLGTYNTRYGPKNFRIRSLRIREIVPTESKPSLATESPR